MLVCEVRHKSQAGVIIEAAKTAPDASYLAACLRLAFEGGAHPHLRIVCHFVQRQDARTEALWMLQLLTQVLLS